MFLWNLILFLGELTLFLCELTSFLCELMLFVSCCIFVNLHGFPVSCEPSSPFLYASLRTVPMSEHEALQLDLAGSMWNQYRFLGEWRIPETCRPHLKPSIYGHHLSPCVLPRGWSRKCDSRKVLVPSQKGQRPDQMVHSLVLVAECALCLCLGNSRMLALYQSALAYAERKNKGLTLSVNVTVCDERKKCFNPPSFSPLIH